MTPEAIRIISQLRQEFYTLFASSMSVPVHITNSSSYACNPSMASWVDSSQQLNYICIYAYTAPDALIPERPFILRVSVNRGAGVLAQSTRTRGCRGLNTRWHFELTLLPEEIIEFLPWIVRLIKVYDARSSVPIPDPPYPLDLQMSDPVLPLQSAWTQEASVRLSNHIPSSIQFDVHVGSEI